MSNDIKVTKESAYNFLTNLKKQGYFYVVPKQEEQQRIGNLSPIDAKVCSFQEIILGMQKIDALPLPVAAKLLDMHKEEKLQKRADKTRGFWQKFKDIFSNWSMDRALSKIISKADHSILPEEFQIQESVDGFMKALNEGHQRPARSIAKLFFLYGFDNAIVKTFFNLLPQNDEIRRHAYINLKDEIEMMGASKKNRQIFLNILKDFQFRTNNTPETRPKALFQIFLYYKREETVSPKSVLLMAAKEVIKTKDEGLKKEIAKNIKELPVFSFHDYLRPFCQEICNNMIKETDGDREIFNAMNNLLEEHI